MAPRFRIDPTAIQAATHATGAAGHRDLAPLPIDEIVPAIVQALCGDSGETPRNGVVIAPPGAGKTTRIAPALAVAAAPGIGEGAIVLLQPRRVAARSLAGRIAAEQGWRLGEQVGYHVRFDNKTTARTRVRVLTEGILARQILADPFLEGVSCVILDEFHERSLHTDIALALLREIQETVRPDLRLLVMSATLDPGPVAEFLGGAPIFRSQGRLFPVEIEYLARESQAPVWEQAAEAVRRALAEPLPPDPAARQPDHILVFLPGMGEIRRTQALVADAAAAAGAEVHVLHGSVSTEEQDRALAPGPRRKLILATNIAETSITIDGVRTVIDSGFARVLLTDERLGIDRLERRRISAASADQRAGRAGRTSPGRALRLWTRGQQAGLETAEAPEIHRVDLAATLLLLRGYGVRDAKAFRWFDPPRPAALERAIRLLSLLGATTESGELTKKGERLSRLPLHPRLGNLLLAGAEAGRLREAATLAALLSERDGLAPGGGASRGGGGAAARSASWTGDSDLLELLEEFERDERRAAPVSYDPATVRSIQRVRDDLVEEAGRVLEASREKASVSNESGDLRRIVLCAFPDRVTVRRGGDANRGVMVGGRGIVLDPASMVKKAVLFVSLDPRDPQAAGGGAAGVGGPSGNVAGAGASSSETRVRMASAIEARWLGELFPRHLETRATHRFDVERGRVATEKQTLFCGLVIASAPAATQDDPEGAAEVLFEHLRRRSPPLLDADEDAVRLLARIATLRKAMPELGFPGFTPDERDATLREACRGKFAADDVRGAALTRAIEAQLAPAQAAALARHAPETFLVPSGNRIRIQYDSAGGAPVLAVRMQEIFGLADSPTIASGRVRVTMHLLAPSHRPIQITSDLRGFWNGTWAEVRRELKIKYPKHPWPEDPWNAPAVSIGGRRRTQ